jgi:hypothetical protein
MGGEVMLVVAGDQVVFPRLVLWCRPMMRMVRVACAPLRLVVSSSVRSWASGPPARMPQEPMKAAGWYLRCGRELAL